MDSAWYLAIGFLYSMGLTLFLAPSITEYSYFMQYEWPHFNTDWIWLDDGPEKDQQMKKMYDLQAERKKVSRCLLRSFVWPVVCLYWLGKQSVKLFRAADFFNRNNF